MDWIEQFIEMLFPLDRRKMNIEGAYMLKHTNLPQSIYKYREINKNSLKNLTEDTIWLSNPSNFNDPYDCSHTFNQELLTRARSKEYLPTFLKEDRNRDTLSEEAISIIQNSNDPTSSLINVLLAEESKEKRVGIKKALLAAQIKMNEDLIKDSSQNVLNGFKICSFSEKNNSMLMWSHYANYHKGFCLEYDLKKIKYADYRTRFLYPVIYSHKMFDATEHMLKAIEDTTFNNLYLTKAALIKAIDWQYEKEWRLVFANGMLDQEQSYSMGKPKALLLGAKIDPDDQKELIEICRKKSIPFFKMKIHTEKFSVIPTTIKDAEQYFFKKTAQFVVGPKAPIKTGKR